MQSGNNKAKRERPASNSPRTAKGKQKPRGPRPVDTVRLDGMDHWPLPTDNRRRCAWCTELSRVSCSKMQCFPMSSSRKKLLHYLSSNYLVFRPDFISINTRLMIKLEIILIRRLTNPQPSRYRKINTRKSPTVNGVKSPDI